MKIYIIKPIFLLLSVLCFNNQIFSQNSTTRGLITDGETKKALANVSVTIKNSNKNFETDSTGTYIFDSLPAGEIEINFSKIGYVSKVIKETIAANEKKEINVAIDINAILLQTVDIESDRPLSAASSKYLSKIDFENRPKNSAQDMLRLVPGLFIAQHAGGGKAEQIFIRGFDCDHGTDVATFVDGIPVNMPSHGHGQGYEDLHFLIPETVKEMDIFKGPYSPQYGNFATGAAVEFNTADTLENNLLQFETMFVPKVKTIASNRLLTMLQLPKLSNNFSSYFAVDAINNRSYFEASQKFNRINIFSKSVFTINENSKLSITASAFSSSWNASGQVPERGVSSGYINRFGSIDNTEGGITSRNNLNLIYNTKLGEGDFEMQAFSSIYNFKLFSNFTFFLNDSINGDQIQQGDNRSIKGINAKFSKFHSLGKLKNKFTIGVSARNDNIDNELWNSTKRIRTSAIAQAKIIEVATGIYFNESIHTNDHFRIDLGGRYDYFTFDVEDLLPSDTTRKNYSGYNFQTLFSPKINIVYQPKDKVQFFLNSGGGYHSNDARSSVQESSNHKLPVSYGAELGALVHIGNNFVLSTAFWGLVLENELVFVGDDGTTENKGSSQRTGIDVSARYQLAKWLFADFDLNISKNIFTDTIFGAQLDNDFLIPLAPTATSAGGLTFKNNQIEIAARYRLMTDRPANESNTVIARGYNIIDVSGNYKKNHFKIGLNLENILNTKWNEAQFDTESRLPFETLSTSELHFTPGTPFAAKLIVGYIF